jgi:Cof subfamily protein (haloacid dehalogenase superfamily)
VSKFSGVLLVTDLDGTLLDNEHEVTRGNMEALRRFIDGGGLFTIATGRSRVGAESVRIHLPINTAAILSNGGVVYNYATGEYVHIEYMDEKAMGIADVILAKFPRMGVEVICKDTKYCINRGLAIQAHFDYVCCTGVDITSPSDVTEPWVKLLAVDLPSRLQPLGQWLIPTYGGQLEVCYSAPTILEVQNKGTHKGAGLTRLMRHLGIGKEHTYACGDNDNDVSMLGEVYSFAPRNASESARNAANVIGPGNCEDFMAYVVEQLDERYAP